MAKYRLAFQTGKDRVPGGNGDLGGLDMVTGALSDSVVTDQGAEGRPREAGSASTGTFERPLYTQLATAHFRSGGRGQEGEPGTYEVVIVFRHLVQAAGVDDTLRRAAELEGDSGMGIPGPVEFAVTTGDVPPREVRVRVQPNAAGRVAKAVSSLEARNFGDARSTVYSHIGPLLSRLAFEADAPIDVLHVDVTALATGDHDRSAVMRGRTRRFLAFPEMRVPPPFFRAAFGIYREGLNSTNPFYALLCFYRVAEGAINCSTRQSKYAAAHGIDPSRTAPVVEDVDEISGDFPEVIGWKCTRATVWLSVNYRVPVAHGLEGVLHAPDEMFQRDRYWRAVPLARQVAHKLVAAEWEFRQKLGLGTIAELDA